MEGDGHLVVVTGDGARLGGAAILLVGDLDVVVAAGGVGLQIETLESDLNLLPTLDLQCPGLSTVE